MKSLFDQETYEEIERRVGELNSTHKGQWGKMDVGQMVWHCQLPLQLAIKNKAHNKKGSLLVRFFFKKSLYNDRPWRKNLPTLPVAKATEPKDFTVERYKLLDLIRQFHELKNREEWNPHPMFGRLTPDQWGKLQYKHLDHHLRQFGV